MRQNGLQSGAGGAGFIANAGCVEQSSRGNFRRHWEPSPFLGFRRALEMDYARSLSTGKEYSADSVTYDQARALKLVCPVCKEKVFKRVRKIPSETHFFCHHRGGSPDCEL